MFDKLVESSSHEIDGKPRRYRLLLVLVGLVVLFSFALYKALYKKPKPPVNANDPARVAGIYRSQKSNNVLPTTAVPAPSSTPETWSQASAPARGAYQNYPSNSEPLTGASPLASLNNPTASPYEYRMREEEASPGSSAQGIRGLRASPRALYRRANRRSIGGRRAFERRRSRHRRRKPSSFHKRATHRVRRSAR